LALTLQILHRLDVDDHGVDDDDDHGVDDDDDDHDV